MTNLSTKVKTHKILIDLQEEKKWIEVYQEQKESLEKDWLAGNKQKAFAIKEGQSQPIYGKISWILDFKPLQQSASGRIVICPAYNKHSEEEYMAGHCKCQQEFFKKHGKTTGLFESWLVEHKNHQIGHDDYKVYQNRDKLIKEFLASNYK